MYELTTKDGDTILAEYKEGLGWYDMQGYKLKQDCWAFIEEIK